MMNAGVGEDAVRDMEVAVGEALLTSTALMTARLRRQARTLPGGAARRGVPT